MSQEQATPGLGDLICGDNVPNKVACRILAACFPFLAEIGFLPGQKG
jgi:hypothetical protein